MIDCNNQIYFERNRIIMKYHRSFFYRYKSVYELLYFHEISLILNLSIPLEQFSISKWHIILFLVTIGMRDGQQLNI